MAVAAVFLEFGVSIDDRSRNDKLLKQVLRTHDRCGSAGEYQPDREHLHEAPAQWSSLRSEEMHREDVNNGSDHEEAKQG